MTPYDGALLPHVKGVVHPVSPSPDVLIPSLGFEYIALSNQQPPRSPPALIGISLYSRARASRDRSTHVTQHPPSPRAPASHPAFPLTPASSRVPGLRAHGARPPAVDVSHEQTRAAPEKRAQGQGVASRAGVLTLIMPLLLR